jgi:hypothetical protein
VKGPIVSAPDDHAAAPAGPARVRGRRRLSYAVGLFFLAPLMGEYLLGNLKLTELYLLPILGLLYGAGAVLIREVTRRRGRGYTTMLGLGLAYALVEEGLVTQLLFNQDYFSGQRELATTVVPVLGIDVWLTLIVVAMHVVWSITIPIMLVEACSVAEARTAPWLGRTGVIVIAAIFAAGCVWLGIETYRETGFWVSPGQLVVTVGLAAACAGLALTYGGRRTRTDGAVPAPWLLGIVSFAASSLYMLTELLPGWTRVAACLVIAVAVSLAVYRWSGRREWSGVHTLALAGGALLTYAWLGMTMEPETGPRLIVDYVGSLLIIGLVGGCLVRGIRRSDGEARARQGA